MMKMFPAGLSLSASSLTPPSFLVSAWLRALLPTFAELDRSKWNGTLQRDLGLFCPGAILMSLFCGPEPHPAGPCCPGHFIGASLRVPVPQDSRVPIEAPLWGFPGGISGKEPACQCRRHQSLGLIPGWGRSFAGGHSHALYYSCLEKPMHRGACWAAVHRVAEPDMTEATLHAPTHRALQAYSPSWPGKSPLRFALLFVFCSASCVEFLASLEYIQTHLREKHEYLTKEMI